VTLRIYDTLTREKREFTPVTAGRVAMYVCGMTVQDKPHVGHIRAALSGDLMRRYFLHAGFEVTYVFNFTDVDDKIIDVATREGTEFTSVSERNIEAYLRAADLYNILPATHYPRATRHIPEILELIRILIERGHAYAAGGDVYFDVRSKADYGKLSNRDVDEMRSGARIEPGEIKRDPLDFALWKGVKPGEPAWDSPWGPGRPGWHIECSAMSMKYLGETFDIHGGGQDLVFPHHENEIAQSECATGKPFARFWCENGLVMAAGGGKISKSTGTGRLFYVDDIARRVDPEVLRTYLLSTHYRSPIEFNEERLAEAAVAQQRLRGVLERAEAWDRSPGPVPAGDLADAAEACDRLFHEAMDDDFNSARAIGHLFDLSREVNRGLDEGSPAAPAAARALLDLGGVLGLFWKKPAGEAWPPEVLSLVQEREQARKDRDWKRADELRQRLLDQFGAVVEDVKGQPPRLKKR
jgi:cysteinyl-tRNA synthetase